ncbi:MAG: COX15/CtaA family protein [Bdellovibrionia bacterium]
MKKERFSQFALGLLLYTVVVILWGAWVRISHSGDGCGDTWPLCHGQLIPEAEQGKTWVEFSHRITSGIYGIAALFFYLFARKLYALGNSTRRFAGWSLFFTITEAALGAKLVIFGLVASNDTAFRALVMALHQVNSLLLTAAVALTWLSACYDKPYVISKKSWPALLFILIATTGAWAALAGTLFPSESLWSGLQADFAEGAHFLLRLRVLHPLSAILIGGALIAKFWLHSQKSTVNPQQARVSQQTALGLLVAIAFGASTLLALSPTWMKVSHLALTHFVWVLLWRWLYSESSAEPAKR